jgi:glyoxylase-like metal-dependent hydrolase (beta-lactamase superfamily II)
VSWLRLDMSTTTAHPKVQAFYDPKTFTVSYVVWDAATLDAVAIDSVLDYDPGSSTISTESVDRLSAFVREHALKLHAAMETHAHADHLSGAQILKRRFGVPIVIGARIDEVQTAFKPVFDLAPSFATDGSQFDRLLRDDEVLDAGSLRIRALATPGHTPACLSYVVGDAVFTGDALFTEDYGTGRCDFPKGSAEELYASVHDKLYALPDDTRVFVGHDYQPDGRAVRWETSIGRSKRENVQLRADTSKEAFVAFRKGRDAGLAAPKLLLPSVQVNVDAGRLPAPHANGSRYLSVPLRAKGPVDASGLPLDR